MIAQIEAALKTFVETKMQADVTLAAIPFYVRPASSEDELLKDRSCVILRVQDAPREIPNLYDVAVEAVVSSPLSQAAVTLATHQVVVTALGNVWDEDVNPTAAADLSTQISAELPGWHGADFFAEGWQPGREDTALLPVFAVKVGVAKDGL